MSSSTGPQHSRNHFHEQLGDGFVHRGPTTLLANNFFDAVLILLIACFGFHHIDNHALSHASKVGFVQLNLRVRHQRNVDADIVTGRKVDFVDSPHSTEIQCLGSQIMIHDANHLANLSNNFAKLLDTIFFAARKPIELIITQKANPHIGRSGGQAVAVAVLVQSPDELLHRISPCPANEKGCVADVARGFLGNSGAERNATLPTTLLIRHANMTEQIPRFLESLSFWSPQHLSEFHKGG
mmetsp:Transcript_43638/g.95088  ORF Transcript_43638/g.95088 Transcript_43638/m.95088 type:complete len:240 (+) Transcript_43638:281-1000(+)